MTEKNIAAVFDTFAKMPVIPRRRKEPQPARQKSAVRKRMEAQIAKLREWFKKKNEEALEDGNSVKWNVLVGGDPLSTAHQTFLFGVAITILLVDYFMSYPSVLVLYNTYTHWISGKHWTDILMYYMPVFRWGLTAFGVAGMVFFIRSWLDVSEGVEDHLDAEGIRERVKAVLTHKKDCESE